MSTTKAEYVSLSACCAQVIWMRTQLLDYGFCYNKISMYYDSKSAISISCNPVQHSRTKHINIHYQFIKEHVEKGTIELYFVGTEYQLADLFTKSLPKERFEYLVHRIVFHMAQQIIPATQLVPKFQGIRRCNNYDMLQSIPCSPECKIVGKILLDHPLIGYQGVVDKLSDFYTRFLGVVDKDFKNCVSQKKNVIQYPHFTKFIIANLMKKFPSIPPTIEEDYHSIKYDITLEIRGTDDFKESTPGAHRIPTLTAASPQGKKRKQSVGELSSPQKSLKITIRQKQVGEGEKAEQSYDDVDDSDNRLEPRSHKENPKHVDDDDDKEEEEVDEKEGNKMGSLDRLNNCNNIVPELTFAKSNEMIKEEMPRLVDLAIQKDREIASISVPELISKEFATHGPKLIEELFRDATIMLCFKISHAHQMKMLRTFLLDYPLESMLHCLQLYSRLIIADLMKKYPFIPHRPDEDYHFIKDDIPLEYEIVFVRVEVPMNQPQLVISTQGTHRNTPRAHKTPTLIAVSPQGKKRKQSAGETKEEIEKMVEGEEDEESYASEFVDSVFNDDDDFGTRIEPGSHKENLEVVDEDEVNDKVKQDEKKDDDTEKTDDAAKEKDTDGHTNHTLVETYAKRGSTRYGMSRCRHEFPHQLDPLGKIYLRIKQFLRN
ncbi:hypothetical protein Tco_0373614 [Tanacetum coccineum]